MKTILAAFMAVLLVSCGADNGVSLKPLNSIWTVFYVSGVPNVERVAEDLRHIEIGKTDREYGQNDQMEECYYDTTFYGTLFGGTYETSTTCGHYTLIKGTFRVSSNNILTLTKTYQDGLLSTPLILRAE